MKFMISLFVIAMLIASALSVPVVPRVQGLAESLDSSLFAGLSSVPHLSGGPLLRSDEHPEQYSANWAGAFLNGTGYKSVTGQFEAPTIKFPPHANPKATYCGSIWVGIDGATCASAILQTGIEYCVNSTAVTYGAWFEWFPDWSHNFKNFSISAGDIIKVSVDATSLTTGSAVVENLSKGEVVSHEFKKGEGVGLCEENTEWIVEDFSAGGAYVPFADFGKVTISNARAITADGKVVGPSDAILVDIQQDRILTSSSHTNDSVTVSYVG
ncbi:unnamed protein product [Penicillium salamii]|nr:unnamed protein product [Penicillium salamii]CAG8391727.1 unnamed protein product [Penicillium salamii]